MDTSEQEDERPVAIKAFVSARERRWLRIHAAERGATISDLLRAGLAAILEEGEHEQERPR